MKPEDDGDTEITTDGVFHSQLVSAADLCGKEYEETDVLQPCLAEL